MQMFWWLSMCLSSCINSFLLYNIKPITKGEKYSKILSSLFLFSTTVRAVFPRIDVERICFFDSFISSTLVGRSLATIGEISFAIQITLYLLTISKNLGINKYNISLYLFPIMIVIAQGFCWTGVITKKQINHCIEESIWMLSVAFLLIPTFITLLRKTKQTWTQYVFISVIILSIMYVLFMAFVDIPMYYKRYNNDEKKNIKYLTFTEGLKDCMSCNTITRKWETWKEDSYWMFGYFTIATLISILMIKSPKF